jgi:hypothetical protein
MTKYFRASSFVFQLVAENDHFLRGFGFSSGSVLIVAIGIGAKVGARNAELGDAFCLGEAN